MTFKNVLLILYLENLSNQKTKTNVPAIHIESI